MNCVLRQESDHNSVLRLKEKNKLQNLNNYIKFWPILTTSRELLGYNVTMVQYYYKAYKTCIL